MWFLRAATLLRRLGRSGLILLFALRHPGTPAGLKLAVFAMLAYIVSPIDLLPGDFLSLFGLTDDAAVLLIGIPFLLKKLPVDVQQDLADKVERLLARFGMGGSSAS